MIIGAVGSGKSSVLQALLGEMHLVSGRFHMPFAAISYCAQEPWIQNTSFRENILFGQRFDPIKYKKVLQDCALVEDLETFPAGDSTEIGENGINLSGGQKARLSLARALYQPSDLYLLDDVLSAVDAHVANHLMNHAIFSLKMEKKTVLLATNNLAFLEAADKVLLMKEGTVLDSGRIGELRNKHPDLFPKEEHLVATAVTQPKQKEKASSPVPAAIGSTDEEKGRGTVKKSELITEEERNTGYVEWSVYKSYLKRAGAFTLFVLFSSLFLMQASRNVDDWWLSYWVVQSEHHPHRFSLKFYMIVYLSIAIANSIFTLIRAFSFAYAGLKTAKIFHNGLLQVILSAKVSFFDQTPVGRILNRFSSDQYSVDDSLPFIANIFLAQSIGLLGTLIVLTCSTPLLAVIFIPLAVFYYFIQKYYRMTSREIKRLDSISRSPIYAHFSESIHGASTIRAYDLRARFETENSDKLDANQKASLCGYGVGQWLNIRLQLLGVVVVSSTAFFAVLQHHFHLADPGLVGLAISYSLSITGLLNGCITSFTGDDPFAFLIGFD
jgi:ATP-binding cassette subfamily C (CFTR/MRP) protein 10